MAYPASAAGGPPLGAESCLPHRPEPFVIQRRWRTTLSRHRLPLFVAMVCSATLFAGAALAASIPSSIKTSSTPPQGPIDAFLKTESTSLASADPLIQKPARDALIAECSGHSGLPATPEYETLYATELGKQLTSHVAAPSLRLRLNVAIIAYGVAAQIYKDGGSTSGLAPLVQALLQDKQQAVVLWAIKAAKYVLASQLNDNVNPSALAKAVFAAVKNYGDSGPIVEEAFSSLTLEGLDKLKGGAQFQQNAPSLIPAVLDLFAWRGQRYKNGDSVPSPLADRPVTVFVPVTAFGVINSKPGLLNQTLKVMGETTCSSVHSMANGNASQELLDMIKADGDAFSVFGRQMSNPAIEAAGKAIQGISQSTDPTKASKMCDDLVAALKGAGVNIAADNGPGAGEQVPAPAIAGSTK